MTALKEYARLESSGIWQETPEDAPRDVIVSFGDATLVIADNTGLALSHWALAAVTRLNPGTRPARFAPDAGVEETLIIDYDVMIDAIETVRKTLIDARPRPPRLRFLWTSLIILFCLALAILWLPHLLRSQTLAAVPPSKRGEIGATVLGHMQVASGPSCRGVQGRQALSQLHARLFGVDTPGQIVVAPTGNKNAVTLPGGIIVLDKAIPESTDDPAISAGYILAAQTRQTATDPLEPILQAAGLQATMTLFTTGELPADVLKDYADHLLTGDIPPVDVASLHQSFESARVESLPYARFAGQPELANFQKIEGQAVMGDWAWIALQGICDL